MSDLRIALSTGVLRVPPTYFALAHAERLRAEYDFCMFTLAADINDPSVRVRVADFAPARSFPFSRRKFLAPFGMPAMARGIERFHPDVIHQHFATWSIPAVAAARRTCAPMLTTVHGYDVRTMLQKPQSVVGKWHQYNVREAQARSARVLAVSNYLATLAVSAGFDPGKLDVHYLGVDTDFWSDPTPSVESEPPIVLFVGALTELKGIWDLVRASRELIRAVEHQLVVIGEGPLREELDIDTKNDRHVTFLGGLDQTQIRSWYARARVMALPTQEYKGSREAAGLVLLESQSCGTPVVAYDSGGTSEMVEAGVSGLLVPEKDVSAMRSALADVLCLGSREYAEMSASARRFAVEERSLEKSSQELRAHYEELAR